MRSDSASQSHLVKATLLLLLILRYQVALGSSPVYLRATEGLSDLVGDDVRFEHVVNGGRVLNHDVGHLFTLQEVDFQRGDGFRIGEQVPVICIVTQIDRVNGVDLKAAFLVLFVEKVPVVVVPSR